MIIPLSTDLPRRRPTKVTYWIIAINIAVAMVAYVLVQQSPDTYAKWFGGQNGKGLLVLGAAPVHEFHWWALFTYQFLHGGVVHLLGNMVFLYVFGPNVEDKLTRIGFVGLYLIGGIAAGGAHLLLDRTNFGGGLIGPSSVVGASGSIAAVTGAFLVLFPLTNIRALFFLIVIGIWSFPAWWLIAFAIVKDLFMHGFGARGVANLAHLGGYAFGSGIAFALLGTKLIARQPYDLFSIAKRAHRRRQFREMTTKHSTGSPWQADPIAGARPSAAPALSEEEIQLNERRTEIARRFSGGNLSGAADAYLAMLDDCGDVVVNRDAQLAIGNYLMGEGRHEHAADVYRLFIERFGKDSEAQRIRLMLAVVCGRYLNDPVEAKRLLSELITDSLEAPERALAQTLATELA